MSATTPDPLVATLPITRRRARPAKAFYVLAGRTRRSWPGTLHAAAILVLPALAIAISAWDARTDSLHIWPPAIALILYVLTMLGVTVGFHRLFSHRAFQTSMPLRVLLAILGSMAAQGPVIYWVSNHRRHHRFSDEDGDPHSPHRADDRVLRSWRGFWHAHVAWTFTHRLTNTTHICKDLLRDPAIVWVNRHYRLWVAAGLIVPAAMGVWFAGHPARGAWLGLLWGGGVRLFWSYHMTNAINSITHMFGYRTWPTPEQSRNNLWLGLPTLGEAWHNNHHAWPAAAIFGLRWWEIDLGGLVIRLLEQTGLAWNVRRAPRRRQ